jgi:hypothetical protein
VEYGDHGKSPAQDNPVPIRDVVATATAAAVEVSEHQLRLGDTVDGCQALVELAELLLPSVN